MSEAVNLTKPRAKKPAAKARKVTSKPFASVDDIKIGMVVRDPATGLTGVASMRSQQLSGTVQYAVQPEGDGKTIPEGQFIDDFMLEFVKDGVSARCPKEDTAAIFRVGEELADTVTGFRGVAIERTTYLNGCVHYTVQPAQKRTGFLSKLLGEPPRATHFDYKRLKKVGEGVAKPLPKVAPVKAVVAAAPAVAKPPPFQRSSTGGPMRSTSGYSQRG